MDIAPKKTSYKCSYCLENVTHQTWKLPEFEYDEKKKQIYFCSDQCKSNRIKLCQSIDLESNVYYEEYPNPKKEQIMTLMVAARSKKFGSNIRSYIVTCFICRSSFNGGYLATEEKITFNGANMCSWKCHEAYKDCLMSVGASPDEWPLSKQHKIKFQAAVATYRRNVLFLPKAGEPRRKKKPDSAIQSLPTVPISMPSFQSASSNYSESSHTSTMHRTEEGGLTLKVYDENKDLFHEIAKQQEKQLRRMSDEPVSPAINPGIPPPNFFGGFPPGMMIPGMMPGMMPPGMPPPGMPPIGMPPFAVLPPSDSSSDTRKRSRSRSPRRRRSRSRSRDRERSGYRRDRSHDRSRRTRRSRSRDRSRRSNSNNSERKRSRKSSDRDLPKKSSHQPDPIYDGYDEPLDSFNEIGIARVADSDDDTSAPISLRDQILELERVILLKDEQIQMKEERSNIKEQQIQTLRDEMEAQYASDGQKIADLEKRLAELQNAAALLKGEDNEGVPAGEKLSIIQELRGKAKQIRELEDRVETFKRREVQLRDTVEAWKDEVDIVRTEYEGKCVDLNGKLEEAEQRRAQFAKTMEIATEAGSIHLKSQITDLEERLRLTNENNELLRRQLLDRTSAPSMSQINMMQAYPHQPRMGHLPAVPPSLYSQPPPPLPGTVTLHKNGPAAINELPQTGVRKGRRARRAAAKINTENDQIDLTESEMRDIEVTNEPKRQYSDGQTTKRREKLLLRLMKKAMDRGVTFAPEAGGALEPLWFERGYDKNPPTLEDVEAGLLPQSQTPPVSGKSPSPMKAMDPNLGKVDERFKPKPLSCGGFIGTPKSTSGGYAAAEEDKWVQDVQF